MRDPVDPGLASRRARANRPAASERASPGAFSGLRGSALLVLASALPACSAPEPAPPRDDRAIVMPDRRFEGGGGGVTFFASADRRFEMRARQRMSERRVEIRHRFFPSPPSRTEQSLEETVETRYWPTCIGAASNGELCVAGVDPGTGSTILEVWRFDPPFKDPGQRRAVPTSFTRGSLASTRVIHDERAPGLDTVLRIHTMPAADGAVPRVLVQFQDSRRLYEFDLDDGARRLVASPAREGGALVVPLLALDLTSQARRHRDQGMLYVFSPRDPAEDEPSVAVLRDRDLDARIDEAETMSLAEYRRRGYLVPEAWFDD